MQKVKNIKSLREVRRRDIKKNRRMEKASQSHVEATTVNSKFYFDFLTNTCQRPQRKAEVTIEHVCVERQQRER